VVWQMRSKRSLVQLHHLSEVGTECGLDVPHVGAYPRTFLHGCARLVGEKVIRLT